MHLFLLGATGRTGKHILHQALQRGFTVTALVRRPERVTLQHPNLRLCVGSPADAGLLQASITGCEAIISALNISRTHDFPWAPLRTPPDFLSRCMHTLTAAARAQGITRIVVTSAWGVGDTFNDLPAWFRWLIRHSNIGPAYADHARQERVLENSGLGWTIVRPVGLTHGPLRAVQVDINRQRKPRWTISRRSVAAFMLDQLGRTDLLHQKPVIWN